MVQIPRFSLRKSLVSVIFLAFFAIIPAITASQDYGNSPDQIPDVLVSLSHTGPKAYAVIVEKSTQTLFIYEYNGKFREIARFPCSTGQAPGPKSRSGDSKTPEGVYLFTKEYEKKYLSPTYGSRAFPIDYPNLLDRLAGRDGNSIWLHGTNKALKPRDSNGCVVLANRDIDELSRYITLNRTPLVIVEKLSYSENGDTITAKKAIYEFLSQWNDALQEGTYHQYLRFYDPDYLPDILWWPEWNRFKKATASSKKTGFILSIDGISIIRHGDTYVALFEQKIASRERDVLIGFRKLFIKEQGDSLHIVADEFLPSSTGSKKHPLIAAIGHIVEPTGGVSEIEEMVNGWLAAWSAKDIEKYGGYYARGFRSRGMDRKAWLRYKDRLNKKYKYIRVSKENLVIKQKNGKSFVTFLQTYQSPGLKNRGKKQLVLIREDGRWKIYRETWKRR
ncbi:MAG: L,D-transpeptidase family protein [Deltaproteobacteria bacterium]|nr:L,D-transpeptidase family protein [Deltaproteobacteria bacterium]MBW1960197.1 L,D-transpeptidase family protein [Deltaproteobacteria bacterium]MBW1993475.1 L,D-transpeptidase family protein [Deltaproteobacteria bacterium]MBW2150600.1 L,D-transpeptidase family protein [Deltaproteobacteria bacterium]